MLGLGSSGTTGTNINSKNTINYLSNPQSIIKLNPVKTNIKRVLNAPVPPIIDKNTVTCLPFAGIYTTGPPIKVSLTVDQTLTMDAQLDCGAQANIGGPKLLHDIARKSFS